jgi:putative transposase
MGGRLTIPQEAVDLVLRLAKENPSWCYKRIEGAVENLGRVISNTAVANILKAHGIGPAPDRKRQSSWKDFLNTHWDVLAAVDFTTIEVWTKKELSTYYLFFFIDLAMRRVHLSSLSTNPDKGWMLQVARNVTDAEQGFLGEKGYPQMDRGSKCSEISYPWTLPELARQFVEFIELERRQG